MKKIIGAFLISLPFVLVFAAIIIDQGLFVALGILLSIAIMFGVTWLGMSMFAS